MRLDKYLSYSLGLSRREVPLFIKKNEILVNGIRVKQKDYNVIENNDEVIVNGKKIEYNTFVYYMLNKPKGVVSAVIDNIDKTVVELIDTVYDIVPIGRLDKDTTGLLLLTNDGDMVHKLTNPNNHVDKIYSAIVNKKLTTEEENKFMEGIDITDSDNNLFTTKKADIKLDSENNGFYNYLVTIHEGKFHQVKKMFKYFDSDVVELKRLSFGPIKLDNNLEEGKYRTLTSEEINSIKEIIDK